MRRSIARILIVSTLLIGVLMSFTVEAEAASKKETFYKILDEKSVDHDGAIHIAKVFCSNADKYGVKEAVIKIALNKDKYGIDTDAAGYIVGAGIKVYCPRHKANFIAAAKSYQ